ncbi:hypothetical protein Fot_35137 [Forsythia ovata]|uniref:Uncharacterized protein n=1 Tax=Forsythia ovata TaxID=205694 RepID=A0ABD1SKN8_9LAMI
MLPDYLAKAVTTVDSFWTKGWVRYSVLASPGHKLTAAKALAVRSMMLIEEVETSVRDMELTNRNTDTALRNTQKIVKDMDHFQERDAWLQGSLNESKKELRVLTKEKNKLKQE